MRVISLTGATSVTDPETNEGHEASADGVFDLPEPYGLHLTTKHASLWRGEAQHKAAQRAALVEELRNPNVLSTVVAELRERVVDLEAQVAAHEAKLAKPRKTPAVKPKDADAELEAQLEADAEEGANGETAAPVEDTLEAPTADSEADGEPKPARAHKATAAKRAAHKPTPE